MGSPEFALPTLSSLHNEHQLLAVVCQPDRRAGRGRTLRPPAVKRFALEHGLPLLQPGRIAEPDVLEQLTNLRPQLIVVAAYGQILPQALLDVPSVGSINVHASLLPRWRGASPIQAAILQGDPLTGITIMEMDAGMDTGPILSQAELAIDPRETGGSLSAKLAPLGARLLIETLPGYADGSLQPMAQDESLATVAPLLRKADGALDFDQPAIDLERRVRAFQPWPGAYLMWNGLRLAVRAARHLPDSGSIAGVVLQHESYPAVGTSDGSLILEQVQPAGRQVMSGAAFLNGAPAFIGAALLK